MTRWNRVPALLALIALFSTPVVAPSAGAAPPVEEAFELLEGTAILLNQSGDGGGSGGNVKTTSSSTNIFTPAAYVDYKRFGGEPTVTVDRFPFQGALAAATCPVGQTTCFTDLTYQSAPNGLPTYSQFWKSDDLAATFRKPRQVPVHGLEAGVAYPGGGDSHQMVGHVTHKVYFTDLPLDCVNINTSRDLGETFTPDNLGCGVEPGLDDRQWVEEDEEFGPTPCPPGAQPAADCGNVYVSFINFALITQPTLSFARSQKGALAGSFATDSLCNTATMALPITGAGDDVPTDCPDPADMRLQVAGPPVADKAGMPGRPPTHAIYIPFVRGTPIIPGFTAGPPYDLYIARSLDGGNTWTRHLVAHLGDHNPINIFPQLTIDLAGNLYYTWSQTQGPGEGESGLLGEQDVYYTSSTNGGLAWAAPINLTKERNDTAIFPWMVAGDPGRVDLVLYKANTGINSNFAFVDPEGNECAEGDPGCVENPSAWNVYFSQSLNALNPGANFKAVQISAAPNHIGQACTLGLACEGDRDLLDFFTVDVDHLGAAVVAYSDDNSALLTRDHTTRQIAGTGVFKNQNITLQSSWPIRDHAVFDRAGDVYDTAGFAKDSCPGMDILKTTADRRDSNVTVTMTLNSAPTAAGAIACGGQFVTGGVWGAEFWARSSVDVAHHYYIAYRDDLAGGPRVEGGAMDNFNVAVTSLDFQSRTPGTLSGTCFPSVGPPATGQCTIAMTVDVSVLGITPGNALLSLTGVSAFFFGHDEEAPLTRILLGNSEQGDATAAIHVLGSGTV
jgi:hypothetical protein